MTPAQVAAEARREANERREREIVKLARDICWAEFTRKPKEDTKVAYWRKVHPEKQADYIESARWLVFITKKLKPLRILSLVDFPDRAASLRQEAREGDV